VFKRSQGIRHLITVRATARLLRTPLGIAVVATVALATASCTIVAALVDAALLRNPPFREADRLAVLYVTRLSPRGGLTRQRWSFPRFQLLQGAARPALFTQLASFTRVSALTLSDGVEAESIEGEVVSASYFPLLSITPVLGRSFATDEPDGSRRAEVIIGYDLWQRRFGADPTVLGRRVSINGLACAIVGVTPRDFRGLTGRAEIWMRPGMAASITYADYLTTNQNFISVAGLLAPGVTLESGEKYKEVK